MTTCCQRLPPSRLTAAPIPLKPPAIQATARFFGFVGLTTMEDSSSVVLDPGNHSGQTVTTPASERLMTGRSEEHTSELQSRQYLVCRLLLEKKKNCKIVSQ